MNQTHYCASGNPIQKTQICKESSSVCFSEYVFCCKLEIKFYWYFLADNWVAYFYLVLFLEEKVNCQHSTYVSVAGGILSVVLLYKFTISCIQKFVMHIMGGFWWISPISIYCWNNIIAKNLQGFLNRRTGFPGWIDTPCMVKSQKANNRNKY